VISTDRLRERLRYEPLTGWLVWLVRPVEEFPDEPHARTWNTRYAGKRAGTLSRDGRIVAIDNCRYRAARVIWQLVVGSAPPCQVDHKNTDPFDDRWDNLRLATGVQNSGNTKRHKDGTSGFKGVTRLKNGRCQAMLRQRYLGTFDTPEEAHAAYMAAAREHYGEFARGA
jgi:hypothetical protein